MYFFLDARRNRLKSRLLIAEKGIVHLKELTSAQLEKGQLKNTDPDPLFNRVSKTANKLGAELKNYNIENEKLNFRTKSFYGLFSSFFLPWTKAYKLREETGKHLAKAERKFNKLTRLAEQVISKSNTINKPRS